ncbi:MAG: hypothetical protein PHX68_02825 [Alphaproteobacteria bacterium]|nr:hypothetical protein [Alphaproteobacteria bacterium]
MNLQGVLDRSRHRAVVGVIGACGTDFTLKLAQVLAEKRQILVIDGHLGRPYLDTLFHLAPHSMIPDVLKGDLPIHQLIAAPAPNIDIIAGTGRAAFETISSAHKVVLREDAGLLLTRYEAGVIDCGNESDSAALWAPLIGGAIFVLCADTPTSLSDTYRIIQTLHRMGKTDAARVIVLDVNQTQGEQTFDLLQQACRQGLKILPVLGGVLTIPPPLKNRKKTPPKTILALDAAEVRAIAHFS